MKSIFARIMNEVTREIRDVVHGNRNLSKAINEKYSQSSVNIEVNEKTVMEIPAVSSAVELITSTIATLPIKLYKELKSNEIIEMKDDKRTYLLNREPNFVINSYNFKKKIVQDYLLHGNAFIKKDIQPAGNKNIALNLLDPTYVTAVKYYKTGYIVDVSYNYENEVSGQATNFSKYDLIRVLRNSRDGAKGVGLLEEGKEVFKLAINEANYSKNILENGALPLGALTTDGTITSAAMTRLRESFDNAYKGSSHAGKTIILESGLKYQPISLKPNDLDLSSSKKTTLSNISRLFNIPESMINSEANKYSSNEQNNIHFLQYTIAPILNSIEHALNQSYLLESEKMNNYFFKFDTTSILQTTEKSKIDSAVAGLKGGLFTINEARRKLNLKDITELDYYKAGLGEVFVDKGTGQMTIPNLGRVLDPAKISEVQLTLSDINKLEKLLQEIKDPDIEEELVKKIYTDNKDVEIKGVK